MEKPVPAACRGPLFPQEAPEAKRGEMVVIAAACSDGSLAAGGPDLYQF